MSKRSQSINPNNINLDRSLSQAQAIATDNSASARDRLEAQLTAEHIAWIKRGQVTK